MDLIHAPTLGDNAFRYERRFKDGDDGSSDMMLDDYNTGLLLGSDYGASHYDLHQEEDEYTTIPSSENNQNDWMSVDVQALTCYYYLLYRQQHLKIDPLTEHVNRILRRLIPLVLTSSRTLSASSGHSYFHPIV